MSRKFAGLTRGKEKADRVAEAKGTGRRADPDYLQTTVYLPRELHKRVKVALVEDDKELSTLVEELLYEWLDTRKRGQPDR